MSTERPTPFELIFENANFDTTQFELLREQAEAHGAVTTGELLSLPAGGELLRALLPERGGEAHRELIAEIGALLFHAFRYWLHGRIVYALSEQTALTLLNDAAVGWRFRAPAPAGYVQLPRNLFWARPSADAQAEAADGFFWSAPTETEGVLAERLDLLLCLGVRAGRPGLTVVSVSVEGGDPAQWADVQARAAGIDFDNILPGGELQGYHAFTTHAEVLKLAMRVFRYIDFARNADSGSAGPEHDG